MLGLLLLVQRLMCHDIGVHSLSRMYTHVSCISVRRPARWSLTWRNGWGVGWRDESTFCWGTIDIVNELPVEMVSLKLIIWSCLYVVKYIRPQIHKSSGSRRLYDLNVSVPTCFVQSQWSIPVAGISMRATLIREEHKVRPSMHTSVVQQSSVIVIQAHDIQLIFP